MMMSPGKTDPDGNFRFNRQVAGVGRITRSAETRDLTTFRRRDGILLKLKENKQYDVLRAFKRGDLALEQLVAADREGMLASAHLLDSLGLHRALWATIDQLLPQMGRKEATRRRYFTSLQKLRRFAGKWLPKDAILKDLERVPWRELRGVWTVERFTSRGGQRVIEQTDTPASAADWNHLGRALSAFLTIATGDVHHPFRRKVVKRFEREREVARRPRIRDLFWDIIDAVPEHARPCYIVLGVTGFRVGEYLSCGVEHLRPEDFAIAAPDGKTGATTKFVDPAYWPWVELGIPSPLQYNWMRKYFKRAVAELGRPQLTLHDLRHLFAQVAKTEGVPTTDTMRALGQRTPGITRDYEAEDVQADVARAVGRGLTKGRKQA